ATVDGRPAPIRPAYVAFRAVFLPGGKHTVVFTFRPAGLEWGLTLSACGVALALLLTFRPGHLAVLAPEHSIVGWPLRWRTWYFLILAGIVLVSAVGIGPGWRIRPHSRWRVGWHTFTWGSGLDAMRVNRQRP